jgi:membrane fusion protein
VSGNALPSNAQSLFRTEAVEERLHRGLGEIFLLQPRTHWLWMLAVVLCAAAILAFLFLGEYTRKERVSGQVSLSHQSVRQYSPAAGTVTERYVEEGARIAKGDPLFRIYIDRVSLTKGEAQAAILHQIEERHLRLDTERKLQQQILQEEEATLRRRAHSLGLQIAQLDREIAAQGKRLALNAENLDRARTLAAQDIISAVELQDKEQEHLTLQAQMEGLRRNRLSLTEEGEATRSELRNAPLKARNQLSAIERSIHELEQQAVDNESRRELTVVAMADGYVTGVLVNVGQQVMPTTTLLSILPEGAAFEAQLYVPTRAVGFLEPGGKVLVRYQAFPYQKFGQHQGTIRSIARTALLPAELQLLGEAKEQLYRVLVELQAQHVIAYGKRMPLQDGMQLEADLLVDTRKLYEWILEPLYTLRGNYQAENVRTN